MFGWREIILQNCNVRPETNLGVLEFRAEGYERTVSLERPLQEETVVRWETKTRQQITEELLTISEDVTLQLPASDRKALGYDENTTIYLRNLTDQDLERLGVPQNNDVMYVNDQVYIIIIRFNRHGSAAVGAVLGVDDFIPILARR